MRMSVRSPSQESIDAFILTLRLFGQNNDKISTGNMSMLYDRIPTSEANKHEFKQLRTQLNDFLDMPSGMKLNEKEFTNREIFDAKVYGDLAHMTKDKRETYEQLKSVEPFLMIINTYFQAILAKFHEIIHAIRLLNEKVLAEYQK